MRKLRVTCLLFFVLLSIIIVSHYIQPVFSQSSTIVKVETSSASPVKGQTITVTISLTDVQNLYGLEVILDWNATVLQATKVDARVGVESFSDGVLHESTNSPPIFIAENNLTQSEGEYMLDVTSMAPAPSFSGSGNIAKITFNAINVGSSALSLQSQLYDYPPTDRDPRISLAIDHTTQDSSVIVKEATTVTTPSNTPTASATPSSSTATATPILSTPTQTLKPQQIENWGLDFVLPLAVTLVAVLIAVSALTAYRRRKMH